MSLSAKIVSIGVGVTCTCKSVLGIWRALAINDLIADGEEIKAVAASAQFNFIAYQLQRKVAAAWVDALVLKLDLQSGSSHYRQDRFRLAGDDTNSTATLSVSIDKGQLVLRDALVAQKSDELLYGGQFSYSKQPGLFWQGVFSNVDDTTKLERAFEEEIDATLIANLEQFYTAGVVLEIGQQITWAASAYRIERIKTDEITYELVLCSINK